MATLDELALRHRLFLKAYRWRRIDPVPWTPLRQPLAESRLALVSSAGFTLPDQEPFDESIKGGDVSFRRIPADTDVRSLGESHRSQAFDHSGIQADPNLAFPLERARELVERGRIGSLTPFHLSFSGAITAPGRLIKDTAPQAAEWLREAGADVALLVPV